MTLLRNGKVRELNKLRIRKIYTMKYQITANP